MTGHELSKLGVDIERIKVLNDKWIALYYSRPHDPDVLPTVLLDSDGTVAAYENLIDLQDRLPIIIPKQNNNAAIDNAYIKRHVNPRHIPKELDHLSR